MPMSDDRKEYLYKYQKEKLKRIPLDVTKEKYDKIKAAADLAGEKVNGYIKKAIDQRMEWDIAHSAEPQMAIAQSSSLDSPDPTQEQSQSIGNITSPPETITTIEEIQRLSTEHQNDGLDDDILLPWETKTETKGRSAESQDSNASKLAELQQRSIEVTKSLSEDDINDLPF